MIDTLSSGERKGQSLNRSRLRTWRGCRSTHKDNIRNQNAVETATVEGDSPVRVTGYGREYHLSRAGHVESCLNLRRPCRKAKHSRKTDSGPVP